MTDLIGRGANQVPLNQFLGSAAFVDLDGLPLLNRDNTYTGNQTFADIAVNNETLNAISTTISGTAVAVFVYDTRNDSDGGAWRKRCSHTSWYNETLNTATRGATREFPAVALIVATISTITIYDATVSSCPMWMVFNSSSLIYLGLTCVFAINGIVYVGDTATGLKVVNFISDSALGYRFIYVTTYQGRWTSGLADRNAGYSLWDQTVLSASLGIDAHVIQCVAATVLPTAPIDSASGLPIPTVWTGTTFGVTRIAHDGTVSRWTESAYVDDVYNINIIGDYVYFTLNNASTQYNVHTVSKNSVLSAWTYTDNQHFHYGTLAANGYAGYFTPLHYGGLSYSISDITYNAISTTSGIRLLQPNTSTWGQGLHATITKDFNTGYQFGDIRGAWLCNATAETLTAASLVTNGTFDSDTAWSKGTGTSISGGTGNFSSTSDGLFQMMTLANGKTYIIRFTVTTLTSGQIRVQAFCAASNPYLQVSATGSYSFSVVGDGVADNLALWGMSSATGSIDNITVKLADPDYSYKNQALECVGSLTKAAVATGAELMGYSGWSVSNYLREAYNSAKDFGTASFYIRFWLKCAATDGSETILERDSASTAQRFTVEIAATTSYISFTCDDNTTTRTATSSVAVDDGLWHFYECIYDGAGGVYIYRDGSSTAFASATGAALLTLNNASATLTIGATANASLPLTNGTLALLHIGAGNPSAAQMKTVYEAERLLFQANAKCLLAGTSNDVKAVDYDSSTGIHHCVTGDYYNAFKGLQRVDSASGVWTSINAENGLVIKGA